jgi:hypothetical protein
MRARRCDHGGVQTTAAVLAWFYDLRSAYAMAFIGAGLLVWFVQAPLKLAEVGRRLAVQASFLRRQPDGVSPDPVLVGSELTRDRTFLVLVLLRRAILLAAGVLLLVTTIGLTDPDGPRYVDGSTRLGRDLSASGGAMKLEDLDFGLSLADTVRDGGAWVIAVQLLIPLLFLLVCFTATRPQFGVRRRPPLGIVVALAAAVFAPAGVLLYLWWLMILNNLLTRLRLAETR